MAGPRSPLGPTLGVAFDSPEAPIREEGRRGRSDWVLVAGDHKERDNRPRRMLVLFPVGMMDIARLIL